MASKGLIFDGIACSESVDSAAERISLIGCQIDTLEEGRCVFNVEHLASGDKGLAPGEEVVGRVTYVKKIFKESDCDNERQRTYWRKTGEVPYLYVIGRLFDQAGNRAAQALAAQMRDAVANGDNMILGLSVEGSTISREGNVLTNTILKAIAITIRACNKTAELQVISDPAAPPGYDPHPVPEKEAKSILSDLIDTEKNEIPGKMKLGGTVEVEYIPLLPDSKRVQYAEDTLDKAISAGSYAGSPSSLTGGAALQREELSERVKKLGLLKNQVKAAVRDWDGYGDLKSFLKHALPDVDDDFINRFAELADDVRVRRNILKHTEEPYFPELMKFERLAINLNAFLRKAEEELGQKEPETVIWQGDHVKPGEAIGMATHNRGMKVKVLGMDDDKVYVQHPKGPVAFWNRQQEGTHYRITDLPKVLRSKFKVDLDQHSHPMNIKPHQTKLIEGMDMGNEPHGKSPFGISAARSEWRKNKHGELVYVKPESQGAMTDKNFNEAHRAVLYHNLAHDVFGLGKYVPPTAMLKNPKTGIDTQVIKGVPDSEHYSSSNPTHENTLRHLGDTGELDKLHVMNAVLANSDRDNALNYMMTEKSPGMALIDHDFTFDKAHDLPRYVQNYHKIKAADEQSQGLPFRDDDVEPGNSEHRFRTSEMHPDAVKWAKNLDPQKLLVEMIRHKAPKEVIDDTVGRLLNLQQRIRANGDKITRGEFHHGITEDPAVKFGG